MFSCCKLYLHGNLEESISNDALDAAVFSNSLSSRVFDESLLKADVGGVFSVESIIYLNIRVPKPTPDGSSNFPLPDLFF